MKTVLALLRYFIPALICGRDTVNVGSNLNLSNSELYNAQVGVLAESGSTVVFDSNLFDQNDTSISLETTSAEIINNNFSDNIIGIYVTQAANIISFEENVFQSLRVGVLVENTNIEINLSCTATTRNIFDSCNIGIDIRNGAAHVLFNKFLFNNTGIKMTNCVIQSRIFNNNIGCTFAGIRSHNGFFDAAFNSIGIDDGKGSQGIVLIGDNVGSEIRENWIYAKNNGIFSIFSSGVDIHDNPDINISTTTNSGINANGINLLMSDNDVVDNQITANNAASGITINGCLQSQNGYEIFHNGVQADQGSNTRGITINGGSQGQSVRYNLIAGQITTGILVDNSGNNTLECNELNASNRAMHIATNSMMQDVLGNWFYAPEDYFTQSETGRQIQNGNKFFVKNPSPNANGDGEANVDNSLLSFTQIQNSRFEIDKGFHDTDMNGITEFYPENTNNPIFVRNIPLQLGQSPFECDGTPGPGLTIPTDEEFCTILGDLFNAPITPNAKRINLFHWILLYIENVPPANWPDCLIQILQSENCTGLIDIGNAQHQLQDIFQSTSNNHTHARRVSIDQQLNQIKVDLIAVNCLSTLLENYKKVLLIAINYVQTQDLPAAAISELQIIASLCPYENGDAVHWARSLLSLESDQRYDGNDESCAIGNAEGRGKLISKTSDINIFPNPTSGGFHISGSQALGMITIYNSNGNVIYTRNSDTDKTTYIELQNLTSGLYFVKLCNKEGRYSIKKLTIIK